MNVVYFILSAIWVILYSVSLAEFEFTMVMMIFILTASIVNLTWEIHK